MMFLSKSSVLIVDDAAANIDILTEALDEDYSLMVARDGATALELARTETPDLILLDVMMPRMDGFQVCDHLKSDPATFNIPVIFLTAMTDIDDKTRGFRSGAVDYITKPFNILEVKARVKTHLTLQDAKHYLRNQNELLESKVYERTRQLALTQRATIQSLASLAETRDNDTGQHIQRTQDYVSLLARELRGRNCYSESLNESMLELLYESAPLHDVGKVGVPDRILLKPSRLTEEEFGEMQKHTTLGKTAIQRAESMLGSNSFLKVAGDIAWSHHERWDGRGYPRKLAEEAIPLPGRLMAVADVYDALISKRVYKNPMGHEDAVGIILEGRGTQFDPVITDVFEDVHERFREIALGMADSEEHRLSLLNAG